MQFLLEGYLRVTSPLTIDGTRPRYDEQGRMMYKETELPLSAKKHLERQNNDLPDHLKKKIEVIKPGEDGITTSGTPAAEDKGIAPQGLVKKRFSPIGSPRLNNK